MISKIPVIGDIVIPKEVGEGLFGISFKMKGPPEKIKTSINPIRTITPRFIQKIIDKNKKLNNFYNIMLLFTKRNFDYVSVEII